MTKGRGPEQGGRTPGCARRGRSPSFLRVNKQRPYEGKNRSLTAIRKNRDWVRDDNQRYAGGDQLKMSFTLSKKLELRSTGLFSTFTTR